MVKKTYIVPELFVVQLASRDAMLQSVSATSTLGGTRFGGTTSTPNNGGDAITDADVKGITDVNVWDNEW